MGLPTLLAIYEGKLDATLIMGALRSTGYPPEDVRIYHRIKGTDQVLDAFTGHVAAGQSLTEEEIQKKHLEQVDTLVLMHPDAAQFPIVKSALTRVGNPQIMYEGGTEAEGRPGGVERHNQTARPQIDSADV